MFKSSGLSLSRQIGTGLKIKVRSHHTKSERIKIVTTRNKVMIHPIGRYILDWHITDKDGLKNAYTEKLATLTKTQIYHDHDTESLFIPHFTEGSPVNLDITKYASNMPWYTAPLRMTVINVDLWLIPPSVLAMLMKKDSDLVTHKRFRILLKRF